MDTGHCGQTGTQTIGTAVSKDKETYVKCQNIYCNSENKQNAVFCHGQNE
jgi:hypothetical protein